MGTSIEQARTVTVNTLVMFEIFYVFNSRYLYHSVLNLHGLFGNRLVWLAIITADRISNGFYLLAAHASVIWYGCYWMRIPGK